MDDCYHQLAQKTVPLFIEQGWRYYPDPYIHEMNNLVHHVGA